MISPLRVALAACILVELVVVAAAQQPTPAPSPPRKQPDAAALYATAASDLLRTFAVEAPFDIVMPEASEDDMANWRFEAPEWTALATRAAGELTTFAQAARLPGCSFGPAKDPTDSGYDEVRFSLFHLAQLTAAQGWHDLRAKRPVEAMQSAFTLLRHSRHVEAQPSSFGAHVARWAERFGLSLLLEGLGDDAGLDAKTLARCQVEFDEHLRLRGGRKAAMASIQAEIRRMLDATIGAARQANPGQDPGTPEDLETRLMRDHGEAVITRIEAIGLRLLTPFAGDGDFDLAAALAEAKASAAALRREADPAALRKHLAKMTPEQAIEAQAKVLACMMLPRLDVLLTQDAGARRDLQQCSARLARLRKDQEAAK